MIFYIEYGSGIRWKVDVKSLLGAKQIATRGLTYGCGNVYITDENGNTICQRNFWRNMDRYGWLKWERPDY